MQILGVGTDIVEVERIADVCRRTPRFEKRVFTDSELADCGRGANRFQRLAARFAAKEAVAKAFGCSFGWREVEIHVEPSGKPTARLYGRASEAAGDAVVFVSLSHSREYAAAVAVLTRD